MRKDGWVDVLNDDFNVQGYEFKESEENKDDIGNRAQNLLGKTKRLTDIKTFH